MQDASLLRLAILVFAALLGSLAVVVALLGRAPPPPCHDEPRHHR